MFVSKTKMFLILVFAFIVVKQLHVGAKVCVYFHFVAQTYKKNDISMVKVNFGQKGM